MKRLLFLFILIITIGSVFAQVKSDSFMGTYNNTYIRAGLTNGVRAVDHNTLNKYVIASKIHKDSIDNVRILPGDTCLEVTYKTTTDTVCFVNRDELVQYLDDLLDVDLTNVDSGDILRFDDESNLWKNVPMPDYVPLGDSSKWDLTGADITNNNTGKVTMPKDSSYYSGILDEGDKVGRIMHQNQYGKVEYVSPESLIQRIDSGQAANPTAYTQWVRDSTEKEITTSHINDKVLAYRGYQWHDLTERSKDNLIYRNGDTLWIAYKFNANYDLIMHFYPCMFNKLMTFYLVGLASNTGASVSEDITRTPVPGFLTADGDNIGPIQTQKVYGSFIGGSHGNEGTCTNLAANFNSDAFIKIATPANFVTSGGTARLCASPYTIFTYTSVSNDTILGVAGLTGSYTAADQIQRYDTTASTISYTFLADGDTINSGDTIYCSKVEVNVVNHIYDPLYLPAGIRDTLIVEEVDYDISNGNIDVDLTHTFERQDTVLFYYGMQSRAWGNSADSNIYYAHGQVEEIAHKAITGNPGVWSTYKQIEKIILSNGDKSLCQAMWMDTTKSYMTGRSTSLQATDYAAHVASYKTYWNLIDYPTVVTPGMTKQWRGVYTWFDNSALVHDSTMFAYKYRYNDQEYYTVDMQGAGSETVSFNESIVSLYSEDATVSYAPNNLSSQENFTATATGYGNLYLYYGELKTEPWRLSGLNVYYNSGDIQIGKNLQLQPTTASTIGVITKGANRFLHDFKPAANTGQNTFLGVGAGNFTMTSGTAAESSYNTGVGYAAQDATTTGAKNTSLGWNTLGANTTGNNQVAIGYEALQTNIGGARNVAVGSSCFRSMTGSDNVGIGGLAGYSSGNASGNVFIGTRAGFTNSTGGNNIAIGYYSLYTNSISGNNVALGMNAGYSTTGSGNIFLGYQAGYSETGSNKLYISNTNTATPLIKGDFTAMSLNVFGVLYTGSGLIADNDSTPSVAAGNTFIYSGSANAVSIDALDDHIVGAYYTIFGNSGTYTITIPDGSVAGGDSFNLSAAWVGGVDDCITLYCIAADTFKEVSRSDN